MKTKKKVAKKSKKAKVSKKRKNRRKTVNVMLPAHLCIYLKDLSELSGVEENDVINVILAAKLMEINNLNPDVDDNDLLDPEIAEQIKQGRTNPRKQENLNE